MCKETEKYDLYFKIAIRNMFIELNERMIKEVKEGKMTMLNQIEISIQK